MFVLQPAAAGCRRSGRSENPVWFTRRPKPEVIREKLKVNSPHEILVKEYLRLKEAEQCGKLTPAEKEIVALSEQGIGRAQMMDRLGKSEGTLKN